MAAAATNQAADNQDAALLQACADFQAVCIDQRRRHVTDEESDALALRYHVRGARVETLTPTTPGGLQAKVYASHSALLDQIDGFTDKTWREQASPEERVAIDMLRHIIECGQV